MRRPFDGEVDTIDLSTGAVSLTGVTKQGKAFELSGDVEQVNIVVQKEPYYYAFADSNKYSLSVPSEYWLKFKIKKPTGEAYRVQMETVDIERTARILATDRTAAALEAARVRVGAPERAKIRYGDFMRNDAELRVLEVDEPNPIMVEFYWTERVVK